MRNITQKRKKVNPNSTRHSKANNIAQFIPSRGAGSRKAGLAGRKLTTQVAWGLSTLHISPLSNNFPWCLGVPPTQRGKVAVHDYQCEIYDGGHLLKLKAIKCVKKGKVSPSTPTLRKGGAKCGGTGSSVGAGFPQSKSSSLSLSGNRFSMACVPALPCGVLQPPPMCGGGVGVNPPPFGVVGSLRSKVKGFSRASRRRLLQAIASLNEDKIFNTFFVVLTYPSSWKSSWQSWKRDLDAFSKRFRRLFKEGFFIWRLSFQKRGAPHFHLLVFNVSGGKVEKDWLSRAWYEVVGSGDIKHLQAGTRVEQVMTYRGRMSYASKYLAKPEEVEFISAGRMWGIVSRNEYSKCVDKFSLSIPASTFYKIRRAMARVIGLSLRGWHRGLGLSCFLSSSSSYRLLLLYLPPQGLSCEAIWRGA